MAELAATLDEVHLDLGTMADSDLRRLRPYRPARRRGEGRGGVPQGAAPPARWSWPSSAGTPHTGMGAGTARPSRAEQGGPAAKSSCERPGQQLQHGRIGRSLGGKLTRTRSWPSRQRGRRDAL